MLNRIYRLIRVEAEKHLRFLHRHSPALFSRYIEKKTLTFLKIKIFHIPFFLPSCCSFGNILPVAVGICLNGDGISL
jgi:hypothetical protein